MIKVCRSRISIDEAVKRVGRAIYGDDWISSFTKREEWLVEHYIDGRTHSGAQASTMPGRTTYSVAGWAEYPWESALLAEVTKARDRRNWSKEQEDEVFDWLEGHGFDVEAASFDHDALLGELEKDFPSTPAMSAAEPNTETQIYQTGAPGRPPSRSFLEIEFRHPIWDEDEDLKNSSWVLPEGVTGAMIQKLPDEGLYLSNVVRLLAGNKEEKPADGRELLLRAARGERFAKVLFKAVAHGEIIISGSRDGVRQKIPRETFELPYSLVAGNEKDNAIGPDFDRWPEAQSRELARDLGKYRALQWDAVTVERNSLANWVDLRSPILALWPQTAATMTDETDSAAPPCAVAPPVVEIAPAVKGARRNPRRKAPKRDGVKKAIIADLEQGHDPTVYAVSSAAKRYQTSDETFIFARDELADSGELAAARERYRARASNSE
jgi:hypothetical protein